MVYNVNDLNLNNNDVFLCFITFLYWKILLFDFKIGKVVYIVHTIIQFSAVLILLFYSVITVHFTGTNHDNPNFHHKSANAKS